MPCPDAVKNMNVVDCVFGVTNFWDPSVGYDGEIRQCRNLADACKRVGIKHLVYSTLDRNSDVPHFQSKVEGEDYMRSLGLPLTCLCTSFYFENFTLFFPPKFDNNGCVFSVAQKPTTCVPMYSVNDTGGWVCEIFKHPELYLNKDVGTVGEYITYPELVATYTRVTGIPAVFNQVSLDAFRNAGFPGAEELAANLKFFDDLSDGIKKDRRVCIEDCNRIWDGGENWEHYLRRTEWTGK